MGIQLQLSKTAYAEVILAATNRADKAIVFDVKGSAD